jgi:hypothetical protein
VRGTNQFNSDNSLQWLKQADGGAPGTRCAEQNVEPVAVGGEVISMRPCIVQ